MVDLLPKFKELIRMERDINKIALVMDLRSQVFYDEIIDMFLRRLLRSSKDDIEERTVE